jgi:DNA-binding response OmpR family regulator
MASSSRARDEALRAAGVLGERLLVVEDDLALREVLARGLREEGFEVVTARDGASAMALAGGRYAGIVLDIGLPDTDGRDLCLALRARGLDAPVLFLTAADRLTDRLSGFAAGGDDYVVKPFHLAELVARLRALLRRAPSRDAATPDVHLDPATHGLVAGGAQVALTPTEFRLLAALLAEPGTVVRRAQLVRVGWADGSLVNENTLDQYVARLRRKLADVGAQDEISTVRGVGYRYA